jgi:CHAT domain-containing protein
LVDLPLHAARRVADNEITYAVSQFTIRYAPSLRAVLEGQSTARRAVESLLVVADETLSHASEEAQAVIAEFDTSAPLRLRSQLTRADLLAALPTAAVAHFACHASSSPLDALASHIDACSDAPVTVADLLGLDLANTRLVVLSACESAMSDQTLPDEVLSLASTLAQSGVEGVVGSLWSVPDASTAVLMRRFYELWRRGGMSPAAALCQAQAWMASGKAGLPSTGDPTHPESWAAFVYVGA